MKLRWTRSLKFHAHLGFIGRVEVAAIGGDRKQGWWVDLNADLDEYEFPTLKAAKEAVKRALRGK